jgi:hypothetical protein
MIFDKIRIETGHCQSQHIESRFGIGLDIFRSRWSRQDWHFVSKRMRETLYSFRFLNTA